MPFISGWSFLSCHGDGLGPITNKKLDLDIYFCKFHTQNLDHIESTLGLHWTVFSSQIRFSLNQAVLRLIQHQKSMCQCDLSLSLWTTSQMKKMNEWMNSLCDSRLYVRTTSIQGLVCLQRVMGRTTSLSVAMSWPSASASPSSSLVSCCMLLLHPNTSSIV